MRLGAFGEQLAAWAERPCILTVRIVATGAQLRYTGILRAYHSVRSLRGWALVPPQQHGGFAAIRMTELRLAAATREVVGEGPARRLRFFSNAETIFELQRDSTFLTGPPRRLRRYVADSEPARAVRSPARKSAAICAGPERFDSTQFAPA